MGVGDKVTLTQDEIHAVRNLLITITPLDCIEAINIYKCAEEHGILGSRLTFICIQLGIYYD